MGTSQHGVDVNAQPEVLDHLRERMSETDEFLPHHGDGAAGCTKGRWTVSDWKKSEGSKVLGWCQLASGSQMRTKTQVFRLPRTRSFSASHLRSNLSAMKARS